MLFRSGKAGGAPGVRGGRAGAGDDAGIGIGVTDEVDPPEVCLGGKTGGTLNDPDGPLSSRLVPVDDVEAEVEAALGGSGGPGDGRLFLPFPLVSRCEASGSGDRLYNTPIPPAASLSLLSSFVLSASWAFLLIGGGGGTDNPPLLPILPVPISIPMSIFSLGFESGIRPDFNPSWRTEVPIVVSSSSTCAGVGDDAGKDTFGRECNGGGGGGGVFARTPVRGGSSDDPESSPVLTSRFPDCPSNARLCIKTGSTGRVSTLIEIDEFAREAARLDRGVTVVEFGRELDVDIEAGVADRGVGDGWSNMFLKEETFLTTSTPVSACDPVPAAKIEFDIPALDTGASFRSACSAFTGISLKADLKGDDGRSLFRSRSVSVERRRSRVIELGTTDIAEATVGLATLAIASMEGRGTDEEVGIDVGVAELEAARPGPGPGLDAGADPAPRTPVAAVESRVVELLRG